MSMGMREKIARAIYRATIQEGEERWGRVTEHDKRPFLSVADAALEALLEPTDGMIGAFHAMCDDNGACLVKPGYQAMIRAAKEGK